jgi:CHAD domain-containing protein
VEDRSLREVGRSFADSRDARVRLEVLEKLVEQTGEMGPIFPKVAAALEKQVASAVDNFGPCQAEAVATLQRICDQVDGWPLENLEIAELCCALREAYRRGRKCLRGVNTERTPEEFHSLRKRVKDIWYQSRLLRNLNHTVLCDLEESANTLDQQLGDLHDLSAFRGWLEQEREVPEAEGDVLLGLVCTREQKLELVALDLGARFFAEKPKVFERRLLRYARDWPAPPVCA